MTAVLLDTHVLIWWIEEQDRLSARARTIMEDADTPVYLSVVTAWEMAIKVRIGRLRLPGTVGDVISRSRELYGFNMLPVQLEHAVQVASLPNHHGDPFDHLLIAQCQVENLPLISADPMMQRYGIQVIW